MGDSQPQATKLLARGHPLPRRSPSTRLSPHGQSGPARNEAGDNDGDDPSRSLSILRRNSSDESHETGQSDPRVWFNRSNQNPTIDVNSMEVDSPFFQKHCDSSKDEVRYRAGVPRRHVIFPAPTDGPSLRPTVTQSSSADEFRSVIDDLTIENKRLKEELKRYKQFGSDLMRKDKLFEIKVHGLPSKKKRELEATLRDFASTLESSTDTSTRHKKPSKTSTRFDKSSGGTISKHASSSSSNSRPVDSAYASMSTGPSTNKNSQASASLTRPIHSSQRSNAQKVQSYLEDIPEGLYPRYLSMTEKDKQKLVVRRLEQLFTGEMHGPALGSADRSARSQEQILDGVTRKTSEPVREAVIQARPKKPSRDNGSLDSNGDVASGSGNGNGNGSGSRSGSGNGSTGSPQEPAPTSEQRPTRPLDLDPDRIQVPSENMEYIRHLGMMPPELQPGSKASMKNVSMDTNGWVYLNLLCNLAQLHIINVTPAFIRAAVSSKSTKFQLSPDGQKIRWRGGTNGTRFSSDSSGDASSRDRSSDGDDSSDKSPGVHGRKRKVLVEGHDTPGHASNPGHLATRSSTSVHYKPMFVRQSSFGTSREGSSSQASGPEDSNFGNTSKWDYSGSGSSLRKRRRVDGAIVYYSGMPFCTDLSGDPGDISPTTYMTSTNRETGTLAEASSPRVFRTLSGSSLPYRPFSDNAAYAKITEEVEQRASDEVDDIDIADCSSSDGSEDELCWRAPRAKSMSEAAATTLEACGLGGVQPDDHFLVVVVARCQRNPEANRDRKTRPSTFHERSDSTTASIMERFKALKATSPGIGDPRQHLDQKSRIEYLSARIVRLDPSPLPPPALFLSPFSTSSSDMEEETNDSELLDSEEPDVILPSGLSPPPYEGPGLSRAASNLAYPDDGELSPSDEEGDDSENPSDGLEVGLKMAGTLRATAAVHHAKLGDGQAQSLRSESRQAAADARTQSSVATAGGAESGYNSSMEE